MEPPILFFLILFGLGVWGLLVISKREERAGERKEQNRRQRQRERENELNALAAMPTITAETHTTIIIDRCEGCRCKFDPPRVAAGEYVADDIMQHFCATECYDRIIDLCLPFYYHKGRKALQDPALQDYLTKHYSERTGKYLEQGVYTEVYKWNQKQQKETEKVTNRLRERIRERYQRKAGLYVQPQPALDGSTIISSGSERINPPPDGGCRRGYCYACGLKIGVLAKNDPTLPRGDTFWFCSSFCYTRTLRAWVPFAYRYESDDETWAHMKDRERYFREAVPKLHAYLENIEIEEEEHQPILKLEAELKRLQEEQEKQASYKYPDPPDHWTPSPDVPVVHSIKRRLKS